MPPPGEPRPPTSDIDTFVHWMEGNIDDAAAHQVEAGYVPLHRLNRREYTNAVHYLFDLDFDPTTLLPQDDLSDGFDNVAKVLQVSPTFLDQYLAAARTVAVQAVGNPAARPVGHAVFQSVRRTAALSRRRSAAGHARRLRGRPHLPGWMASTNSTSTTWRARCGSRAWSSRTRWCAWSTACLIYEVKLGGEADQKAIDQKGDPPVDAINKRLKNIRFQARAGQHRVVGDVPRAHHGRVGCAPGIAGAGRRRGTRAVGEHFRDPRSRSRHRASASRPVAQRIFTCYPKSAAEERPCAEQIIGTVARRAYRRPVTAGDVAGVMQAYTAARAGRTFDEGIRARADAHPGQPGFPLSPRACACRRGSRGNVPAG